MSGWAKQRDRNEQSIVDALVAAGAAVQKLGEPGVPDLLVSFCDVLSLLEVKNPDAKGGGKYNTGEGSLTATQTKWWAKWKGKKPIVVQTPAEALEAIRHDGGRPALSVQERIGSLESVARAFTEQRRQLDAERAETYRLREQLRKHGISI